jgi:MYXO-CTERM domain-containing protein
MLRRFSLLLSAAAFSVPLVWGSAAQAGIGACGNIHVEAEASCEVIGGIECEAECEPLNLQAQCAGNLFVECNVPDRCAFEATAECSGSCEVDCMASCENLSAGSFDCRGECVGGCSASCASDCTASCEGDADGAGCEASCRASCDATCEGECSGSCEGTPPMADCSAQCAGSCEGSCRAEANFDCQVECQRPSFDGCTAELSGGCKAECDADGALFCDSQYVDHGGNLDECVSSLRALINAHVETYASGECSGNACEGEAGFSCGCTTSEKAAPSPVGWAVMALGFGLFGLARSRRRRS